MIQLVNSEGFSLGLYQDETAILKEKSKGAIEVPICEGVFTRKKWNFDNEIWTEGATPQEILEASKPLVPQEISKMALSLRLLERNISDQDIFDDIDSIPDSMFPPLEKAKAKVKYITARTFERHDADLNLVATMEGLSQDDVDQIFIGN
ncbi:hypothetical protein [Flavobacterium facile]|uniref:hypothetical protein n=1 Tax=Flavobacterium facile TaxID=2893174 RepID=UPI002E77F6CD|nr:hypothetical protein [Flavobacterium sp. T-12]